MLPAPAAVVVIDEDLGGIVRDYAARVIEYQGARVKVEIRGECASACTLLTHLPADDVCVSSEAVLEFHAPFGDGGEHRKSWTDAVLAFYPPTIRRWIARHGGLTPSWITLKGAELRRHFRACP